MPRRHDRLLKLLVLLSILTNCSARVKKRQQQEQISYDFSSYPYHYQEDSSFPPQADPLEDRTFISDMIGFSAMKLMLLFALPMVFSVFLGAMLVMLFPFPLLTSTTGLAGAAAIGKRQGRVYEDENSVLRILGLNNEESSSRVKKQFPPGSHTHHADKNDDSCIQRIACEVGRENKDENARRFIDKLINTLSFKSQQKWKSAIEAYLDGLQSQAVVIVSDNPNPPPVSLPVGPVYTRNVCPNKYKCGGL